MQNFAEFLDEGQLLKNHPIFSEWINDQQRHSNENQRYDIVITVVSAPIRHERRDNIRHSWWNDCKNSFKLFKIKIKCLFFSELPVNNEIRNKILLENELYGDLIFQPISSGGVAFGQMLLYQLFWTFKNFKYKWFIKTDDDIYLCLKHIINRLPKHILPSKQHYIKGKLHCEKHRNRVDESFITLSYFTVKTFLNQNPFKMKCHPWADQQIAIWVQELELENIFFGDKHYLFDMEFSEEKYAKIGADKRICSDSIDGLHAVHYVWNYQHFKILEKYSKLNADNQSKILLKLDYTCKNNHRFLWCSFGDKWVYYPEFCYLQPVWNFNKQQYMNSKMYLGKYNRI